MWVVVKFQRYPLKDRIDISEQEKLRLKAEESLRIRKINNAKHLSGIENLKLIHELQVHQIELEMQNEELKIAKEQAEESELLKSAFLANMSHEIRTPMNGILGFSQLLKEPHLSDEEQQEYIKIIEISCKRMLNIINEIIDISKVEAGLMKVKNTEIDINEQIELIYHFFKSEIECKGLKFLTKPTLSGKKAKIITDSEKLYAVFVNIVKNAIKFTNTGEIEFGYNIIIKNENKLIEFYVQDTGIGINKNMLGAIFERFIQAEIIDKYARQGAGLGLAISKAYIEMLGGKIWVESEINKGSTFYFTIPYKCSSQLNIQANNLIQNEISHPISNKLKILIAEDDKTSELLIEQMIKQYSKSILKVNTGTEAVEVARNNPDIDLILMDIQMPGMSGYVATNEIRKFNQNVVIIAQTAYALIGDREKAIQSGCNDYITKPTSKICLLKLIDKYFKKD